MKCCASHERRVGRETHRALSTGSGASEVSWDVYETTARRGVQQAAWDRREKKFPFFVSNGASPPRGRAPCRANALRSRTCWRRKVPAETVLQRPRQRTGQAWWNVLKARLGALRPPRWVESGARGDGDF